MKKHPGWVGGWILGNTKIGPVLDVKVCFHQGRHGIAVMIESLFRDRTFSWVRIVNGIDKYVTETSETISLENVEHRVTGTRVAKAKPRPKPAVTLSPISIPVRERTQIDINPEKIREDCFAVSKAMIRLLRHDPSTPREDDGAARVDDLVDEFKARFDGTSQWPVNAFWRMEEDQTASTLTLPDTSCISQQLRDIQEVISLILHCKTMYCCLRTSPSTSATSEM